MRIIAIYLVTFQTICIIILLGLLLLPEQMFTKKIQVTLVERME